MFNFLKKKIKQVFSRTKKELEEETTEEEKEITKEIKEIEKTKETKAKEESIKETEKPEKLKKFEEKKGGLLKKLKKITTTTRLKKEDFDKFFTNLETVLIENNVALEAIDFLKEKLEKDLLGKEIQRRKIEETIKKSLENAVNSMILEPFDLIEKIKEGIKNKKPYVIVFFGINGSGKTTTIAKIGWLLKKHNINSVLAASDTFRAASIEQLEKHGSKLGVKVITHAYGSDPAAVAFDAIAHAKAKGIDTVLIDTAGRIHTKTDLMREMQKIIKVTKADLKIFVGESIVGNDAVEQAKAFNEAVGVDAIILTKADVDEKGGACLSVSYITKKPIIFLGTGQEYDKLKKFDKKEIIKSIFG